MPILTSKPSTPKERVEHRLLIALRFACLMANRANKNPMDCPRVQRRAEELQRHLYTNHPSQLFDKRYIDCAGELGHAFALRVNSRDYSVNVWASPCNNVWQLIA